MKKFLIVIAGPVAVAILFAMLNEAREYYFPSRIQRDGMTSFADAYFSLLLASPLVAVLIAFYLWFKHSKT